MSSLITLVPDCSWEPSICRAMLRTCVILILILQHVSYEGPGESDDEAIVGVASAESADHMMSDEEGVTTGRTAGKRLKDSQPRDEDDSQCKQCIHII